MAIQVRNEVGPVTLMAPPQRDGVPSMCGNVLKRATLDSTSSHVAQWALRVV